jgi:hypothetical protein
MPPTAEHLQQTTGTLHTLSGDETILVNPADGRFFSLTPPGDLAWATFAHPRTAAEVTTFVLAHFQETPADAPAAVRAFLDQLQAAGLLEAVAVPAKNQAPLERPARGERGAFVAPRLEHGTPRSSC